VEEPRPRLQKGHIPTAVSFPFQQVLVQPQNKKWFTFASNEQLEKIFRDAGIQDPFQNRVISYCGSGVTAAINQTALYLLGNEQATVYDGSWAEYAKEEKKLPVEK